jgi:hypothetical protein
LHEVLTKYGVPDPKIVGKLPKGGQQLDFVGHADVTKMLLEIDEFWTWEPVAFDADGLPAYRVENGMAHMAGWLTIHGVRRLGIGSVAHNKQDLLKELVSDFIRNAAMRFGICLSLWTKQEWDDVDRPAPARAPNGPVPNKKEPVEPKVAPVTADTPLKKTQLTQFVTACAKANIEAEDVAARSNVVLAKATHGDLEKLRATYKEMIAELANKPKED